MELFKHGFVQEHLGETCNLQSLLLSTDPDLIWTSRRLGAKGSYLPL